MNTKEIAVEREYEYKRVKVNVLIDFHNETISLIDHRENNQISTPGPKKYVFANRKLGYMKGWQMVFEAMSRAVEMASLELEQYIKEQKEEAAAVLTSVKGVGGI